MTDLKISDLKTLVVDDHAIIRHDLEKFLKNLGCRQVDQAPNADEAQKKIAENNYNVVFLDWNMPGKSGYHLLQTCRTNKALNEVAFVIVSAESDDRYIIEALKAGATSYIVKPVSEAMLQEHMAKVLAWINKRPMPQRQQSA